MIINQVVSGGGTTPTGTKQITSNGVHDVTDYASADVQVPTTAPAHYIEKKVDANGVLTAQGVTTIIDFTGVKEVSSAALYSAYKNNTAQMTLPDLSTIKKVNSESFRETFYGCTGLTGSVNLSSLTNVGERGFRETFYGCTGLTGSVNLSSLVANLTGPNQNFYNTFRNCTGITSVDLSSLSFISTSSTGSVFYYTFAGCTSLTSVDLSSLEFITSMQNNLQLMTCCFDSCTSLSNVNMNKLIGIQSPSNTTSYGCFYRMFYRANLTNMTFDSLRYLSGGYILYECFGNNLNLQTLSFPALNPNNLGTTTSQFNNMLSGCTNVTVHFPSNLQSKIGTWGSVTGGFNGTNTTVLFDLPAAVDLTGANSTVYERNPRDDTNNALAWRVYSSLVAANKDWTSYYTSGTTEPTVGDTIYSDAACTTTVTTISSIA